MRKLSLAIFTLFLVGLANAQDSTLNEYVGIYKFPEGGPVPTVEIKLENGSLTANSAAGSSALEKVSRDTFTLVAYNGSVYFTRDANSKVDGIKIEVQDTILEGKKESAGFDLNIDGHGTISRSRYGLTKEKSLIS